MVNLGDYLGLLMEEIVHSRMQCDLAVVQVAELYSSHPLLKHFPIPRIRLPNVEIRIPVIICEVEEQPNSVSARYKIESKTLIEAAEKITLAELRKHKISLSTKDASSLRGIIKRKSEDIQYIRERVPSTIFVAKAIVNEVEKMLKTIPDIRKKLSDDQIIKMSKTIESKLRDKLISEQKSPPRIKISALTKDIIEIKDTERLVNLTISITEEGIEWTRIEEAGKERDMLVPE